MADVTREERLIRALLEQVRAAGTPRHHLAIKSTTDGEGVCAWNGIWRGGSCTPACTAWAEVIKRAEEYLAALDADALVQRPLLLEAV